MKKLFNIIFLLLVTMASSNAQSAHERKLSLADAMATAVSHRFDAQANKIDLELASNKITRSRNEWLPSVSVNGEVRYNTQLETMVLDGFGGNSSEKIQVGTKNLTNLNIELSQSLYKPGLNTDTRIANTEKEISREKKNEKENAIKILVIEAYLNVILKEQQLKLTRENTSRHQQYLTLAKDKSRLGALLETDLLKAQTDYENARANEQEAGQNYEMAMKTLRHQINGEDSIELHLTDSLPALLNNNRSQEQPLHPDERPELKQLFFSQQVNELELKKASLKWMPTIAFIGNYTTLYQASSFHYSRSLWTPYNYIGLKASLPVTELLKQRTNMGQFQLKAHQLELQYKQKQQDIVYEINKSTTELNNAGNNIETSVRNLHLAQELFNSQIQVFKAGTLPFSTLLDTETSVNTASQNYIKAVYNYLLAYFNYKKWGNL